MILLQHAQDLKQAEATIASLQQGSDSAIKVCDNCWLELTPISYQQTRCNSDVQELKDGQAELQQQLEDALTEVKAVTGKHDHLAAELASRCETAASNATAPLVLSAV